MPRAVWLPAMDLGTRRTRMADKEDRYMPVESEKGASRSLKVSGLELDMYRIFQEIAGTDGVERRGRSTSLRDICRVLFSHKLIIVGTTVLCFIASVWFACRAPTYYESEACVLVRSDRTNLAVDPSGAGDSFLRTDRSTLNVPVRTEYGILRSIAIAEDVVDRVSPKHILGPMATNLTETAAMTQSTRPDSDRPEGASGFSGGVIAKLKRRLGMEKPVLTAREAATELFIQGFSVKETMEGSYILGMTYKSYSPESAQEILNALLNVYLQKHIQAHWSQSAPDIFSSKSQQLGEKIEQLSAKLVGRKRELDITSVGDQTRLLLSELSTAEADLRQASTEVKYSEARVAALEKLLADRRGTYHEDAPGVSVSEALANQIQQRLAELTLQEIELRGRYKSGSAPLIKLKEQISALEEMLAGYERSSRDQGMAGQASNEAIQQALTLQLDTEKADLEAKAARWKSLTANVDSVRKSLFTLTSHEWEISSLEGELEILKNEYLRYINTLQTAEMSTALDKGNVSNVRVLQAATLPTRSTKNSRKGLSLLAFGLFGGFVGGAVLAFLFERINSSMRTVAEVERHLGLPVLVSLPLCRGHKPRIRKEAPA